MQHFLFGQLFAKQIMNTSWKQKKKFSIIQVNKICHKKLSLMTCLFVFFNLQKFFILSVIIIIIMNYELWITWHPTKKQQQQQWWRRKKNINIQFIFKTNDKIQKPTKIRTRKVWKKRKMEMKIVGLSFSHWLIFLHFSYFVSKKILRILWWW